MLMPSKVKFRKQQRGRRRGKAHGGSSLNFGDFGLKAMQDCWEFPGGKVADGEPRMHALQRELREELGIEVDAARHFTRIEHDYPDQSVAIDFYIVERWRGEPEGKEGQQLAWIKRQDLGSAGLLPADAPVVEALLRN